MLENAPMTDTRLGRYHLTRVLGQGSMGIVYEARDPHLDRSVAVKTARTRDLPADQAATYERRFLTEARSAARLRHPSIVSVFDAGKDGEVTYLVMELVDGVNLKHCLNNGVRFTPAGAARLVWSVLNGLEHAHEQRVIHRDVKPENVLLDQAGIAKLTDFGIAKLLESDMDNGTQLAGLSIGTPRYMSPEQVRGLPVDIRTDLYSVGVLLYELLTATIPFDGTNHLAVASQILHDLPPPPSSRVSGVSPDMDALLAKALAKLPADRFQTADAFRQALLQVVGAQALQAPEADPGTEPALSLVQADTAPILRWLFVQARANQPAIDTPPAVAELPDSRPDTDEATLITQPTLPLVPPPAQADPLDGTRVAQREAPVQPAVGQAMQALAQAQSTQPAWVPPSEPVEPATVEGAAAPAAPSPVVPRALDATAAPAVAPVLAEPSPDDATVVSSPAWETQAPSVPVKPRARSGLGVWLAVAALAVGAVVAYQAMRKPAPAQPFEEIIEDSRTRAAATTDTPSASTVAAPPAVEQAPPATNQPAVAVPAAPEVNAVKPTPAEAARARREAKAKADAATPVPATPDAAPAPANEASTAPPPKQPPVDAAATAAPVAKPAPPREPCPGLSFLEREACLWKQCDTDAFRRHPACKRFNPDKSEQFPR